MPEVSIVIPLYNKEPHIARTLNSVLNQTFQDFEVIVVDSSTDNGTMVVKSFKDPRIRLIQQETQGVSAARNTGVMESVSEFIVFLDADDEWTKLHLETILRLRKKYPEAGLYTTAYKIVSRDGKMGWAKYKFIPDPPWEGIIPNYFKSYALGEAPVWSSVVGIPKNIFIEAGGFPRGYWIGEDGDLFGKIALRYPVAFSWELGAIYYRNAVNRACDKKIPEDYEMPFVKTARNVLANNEVKPEFIEPLKEYIYITDINRATGEIIVGNSKTACEILKQCKTKWYKREKLALLMLSLLPNPLPSYIFKLKRGLFN